MDEHVSVEPTRLFTVADLVLEMIECRGGVLGLLELNSAGGHSEQGESVPTRLELEEAVTLLIRLGFIERVDRTTST